MSGVGTSAARIAALAANGFRQAVRDKVLYVLAAFCGLLILGSVIVSQLTVGERSRIVLDLGLSATALLTSLTAVVVSISQLAKEIERRTIDTILAKPVSRWEFLVGRFGGMALTLGAMVLTMGVLHSVVLLAVDGLRPDAWKALLLTWVEAVLVAAMAFFVSSFATTVPSLFITLGFVVIGHTSWGLVLLARRVTWPAAQWLLRTGYVALPNLELLNVRAQVVWEVPIGWGYVLQAAAYGLAYSGFLVTLAAAILSRRDLA